MGIASCPEEDRSWKRRQKKDIKSKSNNSSRNNSKERRPIRERLGKLDSQGNHFVSNKSRHFSQSSTISSNSSTSSEASKKREYETDPEVLARREKQIEYGKNTLAYDRYKKQVSKDMREDKMPRTPPKHMKYSRRQWDGLIKHWKIRIHEWDQSNGASKETNTEISTTTKRTNDGEIIEDSKSVDIEPKDYNTHWLSSKDHRILDWSEECEREEENETLANENDDDFETKRRKTNVKS